MYKFRLHIALFLFSISLTIFARISYSATINVESSPSGALVLIDGKETEYTTPARITGISIGFHTIALKKNEYNFLEHSIEVKKDSTYSFSFKLIRIPKSAVIIGDLKLGIISLPPPPIRTPYMVDKKEVYTEMTTVNSGIHSIIWEGGRFYESLDTIVEIKPGRVSFINFRPKRFSGKLHLNVIPENAVVKLNSMIINQPSPIEISLNTNTYNIVAEKDGFYPETLNVIISKDSTTTVSITLKQIPDMDGDRFLDFKDECPTVYGMYDGCPKALKRREIVKYLKHILNNMNNQNLKISIDALSLFSRIPLNHNFKDFTSLFSDGPIVANNFRGLELLNRVSVAYKGIFVSVHLGEWITGIEYRKKHIEPIHIKNLNNKEYLIAVDSSYTENSTYNYPTMQFPSTSISGGINFKINSLNISIAAGYRWENIIISNITDASDLSKKEKIIFSNNAPFAETKASIDVIPKKLNNRISTHIGMNISSGRKAKTEWIKIFAGISFNLFPEFTKKDSI